MSAVDETLNAEPVVKARQAPILDRVINFISSVRFGVALLCVLVVLSMIGMVIIQQNVNGFDAYFASLTPAEKLIYGWLGFFDLYHSWYFNLLLLILSLNIILASIDRFPSTWRQYFSQPKLTATDAWLREQKLSYEYKEDAAAAPELAEKIKAEFEKHGMRARITESETTSYGTDEAGRKDFSKTVTKRTFTVFGERGRINRLGAYIVHVALLLLFLGHFVANQTGFDADVRMIPGETSDVIQLIRFDLDKREKFDVKLPFAMTCTDIQQKLIDPNGNIEVANTLDWRTQLRIDDPEYGTVFADISLNKPFSYRGYRFFQAQTIPVGNARNISLTLRPESGGDPISLEIPRLGSTTLADGTKIEYEEFFPDFTFNNDGKPDTRSGAYNNPVALLNVTSPDGKQDRVFAFAAKLADNIPVNAPKAGYRWHMSAFEKAPSAHVLSIKYDPYDGAFVGWYLGGFGLMGALAFVFFFSHKRIWANVSGDDGQASVIIGAEANRNPAGIEAKFVKILDGLGHSVDKDANDS